MITEKIYLYMGYKKPELFKDDFYLSEKLVKKYGSKLNKNHSYLVDEFNQRKLERKFRR
ncbi:hypothetical protein AAEO50_07370 [Rossellomorea oryzaecorticis]|uniref:Uncharacterized protein n=1 Tax=Rossellomorea oryzaecorticis TaxID=1396505 RepID=A0ABU9KA48_9BACI